MLRQLQRRLSSLQHLLSELVEIYSKSPTTSSIVLLVHPFSTLEPTCTMKTASITTVSEASYPFDNPNADIILRSSDLVDFRVFSQILIAASPFFEGLFRVPQPPAEEQHRKDGLPIVHMSEDSKTIDAILRLSYPINKSGTLELGLLESAFRAATKYEMELAITLLTQRIIAVAHSRPLEVWAVGCRLRQNVIAAAGGQAAAFKFAFGLPRPRSTFHFHCVSDLPSATATLEGVSAGQLLRLYCYLGMFKPFYNYMPDYEFIDPPRPTAETTSSPEAVYLVSSPALPNMASADVICRSSDGATFYAHRAVLGSGSPVLRARMEYVATSEATVDASEWGHRERCQAAPLEHSLPVLRFEETSHVLPHLIACCYPGLTPTSLADISQLIAIISAAARYDITIARPTLLDQWSKAASADPLRAFFLAIQAVDEDCTHEAAKRVLHGPIAGVYVREMESSPAVVYQRLLFYYQAGCQWQGIGIY